jgi:hypothetical protein
VKRVAATYLKAESFRVIVVGDASVVKEGLARIGLGPVDVRKPPEVSGDGGAAPAAKREKP